MGPAARQSSRRPSNTCGCAGLRWQTASAAQHVLAIASWSAKRSCDRNMVGSQGSWTVSTSVAPSAPSTSRLRSRQQLPSFSFAKAASRARRRSRAESHGGSRSSDWQSAHAWHSAPRSSAKASSRGATMPSAHDRRPARRAAKRAPSKNEGASRRPAASKALEDRSANSSKVVEGAASSKSSRRGPLEAFAAAGPTMMAEAASRASAHVATPSPSVSAMSKAALNCSRSTVCASRALEPLRTWAAAQGDEAAHWSS
mmetsp:Transcript_3182/g.9335  ORF Transcript_3182/g.9335 Transcript_3182/m.9335 type:complete len:257 (-) Transcript_3182:13-783(-)